MEVFLPQVEITEKGFRCIFRTVVNLCCFHSEGKSKRIRDRIKKGRGPSARCPERRNEEVSLGLIQVLIYNNKYLARDQVWKFQGDS